LDQTDSSPYSSSDQLRVRLLDGAQQLSLSLTDHQVNSLLQFVRLLQKWNRVYNLTAVRSVDEMIGRHILDSLVVLKWLLPATTSQSLTGNRSTTVQPDALDAADTSTVRDVLDVLDVGTGAGLPVLPLAIVRPDLNFLSVESNGKKTRFQQQVVLELELRNVRIAQSRIEQIPNSAHTIVSRAFSAPEKFLTVVEKNCNQRTRVIVMLGAKERMPAHLPTGFTLVDIQQVQVPLVDSTRHIALCDYHSSRN